MSSQDPGGKKMNISSDTSVVARKKVKVAAIQMVSSLDSQENYDSATSLLEEAARGGCELAVLPENFITYGDRNIPSETQQQKFIAYFSSLAKSLNMYIVAGTFPLHSHVLADTFTQYRSVDRDDRPYAACVVFDKKGNAESVYTKLHLFDADVQDNVQQYCESKFFRHGETTSTFNAFGETSGLAVCYDLRFPELFHSLVELGSSFICFPSAFTEKTGEAHWRTLICARAVETQSYIIAANQGGEHSNGRRTWGESMIVDPWGNILSVIEKGAAVVSAELDFGFVYDCRKAMPLQKHRRLV